MPYLPSVFTYLKCLHVPFYVPYESSLFMCFTCLHFSTCHTSFHFFCVPTFYLCAFACMPSCTAKNTVISPDFLVWNFCGKAQFLHSFGRFARYFLRALIVLLDFNFQVPYTLPLFLTVFILLRAFTFLRAYILFACFFFSYILSYFLCAFIFVKCFDFFAYLSCLHIFTCLMLLHFFLSDTK